MVSCVESGENVPPLCISHNGQCKEIMDANSRNYSHRKNTLGETFCRLFLLDVLQLHVRQVDTQTSKK